MCIIADTIFYNSKAQTIFFIAKRETCFNKKKVKVSNILAVSPTVIYTWKPVILLGKCAGIFQTTTLYYINISIIF